MIYRMEIIALRPATADDVEFCFDLHKLSFHQYVTEVWGWDEDEQRAIHTRNFQPERVQIITANGVDVGRLDVDYGDQEIFIWLIELLPSHQGRGIGGRLIRTILDEARSQGKAVGLNVLDVNRCAYALYRRLGFIEVRRLIEGPAVRIRMIAAP